MVFHGARHPAGGKSFLSRKTPPCMGVVSTGVPHEKQKRKTRLGKHMC